MASKIKYDVADVEDFAVFDGPDPVRGIYNAKVQNVEFKQSSAGNNMFEIMVRLAGNKGDKSKSDGWPGWFYATIGDLTELYQKRHMKALAAAFGLKTRGTFDPEALATKLTNEQPTIRVVIKMEPDQSGDGKQARVNGILPPKEESDDDTTEEADDNDATEEEDDDEAEEADDTEEEDDEEEDDEEDEGDGDEEFQARVDELKGLTRAELRKIAKDEHELRVTTKMSDDDVRSAILHSEYDFEDDEDAPPF